MSAVITIGKSLETDLPVHISDAKNGLGCNCVCYQCNAKFEAVQGSRDWYFRHSNKSNCKGAPETALHQYAKSILLNNNFIQTNKKKIEYCEPLLESIIDEYRSDVSVRYNKEDLYFEIVVSHDLEPEKQQYYKSNKKNCIKVDLRNPELRNALPDQIKFDVIENLKNKIFIQWNEDDAESATIEKSKDDRWIIIVILALVGFLLHYFCNRRKKHMRFSKKGKRRLKR